VAHRKKDPLILAALAALVEPETAGDPMSAQKWVRCSLRSVQQRLEATGHRVSVETVRRLLGRLEYALHVNAKRQEASSHHLDRDRQFTYIQEQRDTFVGAGQPIVSVDTKKKELVGNFKNAGRTWSRSPEAVNVHDFLSDGLGRAVPYGIYDVTRNTGRVAVGTSGDTAAFAVAALARWWEQTGRAAYPTADRLLILADGGGSNGCRTRLWKERLQAEVCDRLGLEVTVCHYPPGCSKWNPIEHRLFSQISQNWAGHPLRTWEIVLGAIRGTTTRTGLTVEAELDPAPYATGLTVSDATMATLNLERHASCPLWNYTLRPRPAGSTAVAA
jgi:hypothetical protein